MDSTIVGALSALAGVALSGLLNSRHNAAAFKREKIWILHEDEARHLREIYEVLLEHRNACSQSIVNATAQLGGAPGDRLPKAKMPTVRLHALIGMYAPSMKSLLPTMEKALGATAGAIVAAQTSANSSAAEKARRTERLAACFTLMEKIYDDLERIIIEEIAAAQRSAVETYAQESFRATLGRSVRRWRSKMRRNWKAMSGWPFRRTPEEPKK